MSQSREAMTGSDAWARFSGVLTSEDDRIAARELLRSAIALLVPDDGPDPGDILMALGGMSMSPGRRTRATSPAA
jgi:hypothetical protein